jgi:2-polyprenyl-6-methoxyphenol hydroxylase-like FAD-dependent oxidoreductase
VYGQPDPCVIIAGDGIAASAAACVLRDKGFGVVMAAPRGAERRRRVPIIEALPQSAVFLLADIGLASALADAGPVSVAGFHNRFRGQTRDLGGVWTHVDRSELAHRCRLQARRRGAIILRENVIGAPAPADDAPVQIRLGATTHRVFAVIDATGRAARWSRPVALARPATATLYRGPAAPSVCPGVIFARDTTAWAYRLEHPAATTVGVVSEDAARRLALTGDLAAGLDIDPAAQWVQAGVRSASVQWALNPIRHRRLAIGDAALAYSPSAGQGVRFALASALAASAVLATWVQTPVASPTLASNYYCDFVDSARERHLTKLAQLRDPSAAVPPAAPRIDPCARIRFCAPSRIVGQNRGGHIVADEGFVLADGGLTRWVGGIDLTLLREAAAGEPDLPGLLGALDRRGVSGTSALALIGWALRNGALDQPATGPHNTQIPETLYTS